MQVAAAADWQPAPFSDDEGARATTCADDRFNDDGMHATDGTSLDGAWVGEHDVLGCSSADSHEAERDGREWAHGATTKEF